ncbi:MAG: four-carbon acid sugar kinase family protein [Deltaproteobacteria bacterium]|nr:MAG: four-carbon acid sugar kinase family protein [Deltaproteobacteria bacterium]
MLEVAVIADDLTGAADTGIAFALAGVPTFVAFGERNPPAGSRVVAFDTDSRALAADAAAARASAAATRACERGVRTIYKKIDSTLRGNVGAEAAAILRAVTARGEPGVVIACPAFPAMGRTTREGRVFVSGTALEETDVWRKSGMTGPADLASMLEKSGLRTAVVDLRTVREGALPEGPQALVCDAEDESDLRHIAEAGAKLRARVVWVGSGGLARHLPAALGLRAEESGKARFEPRSGSILTLVGSRSEVSREQARQLCQEPGVDCFEIDPEALLAGPSSENSRAIASLHKALAAGRDAVLLTTLGDKVDLSHAPAIAAALGRLVPPLFETLGGLVATGGDIARAVLSSLGASGIHLVGEVEPGVPLGLADTPKPLPLVTKAGAFGNSSTLKRCRAALEGRSS